MTTQTVRPSFVGKLFRKATDVVGLTVTYQPYQLQLVEDIMSVFQEGEALIVTEDVLWRLGTRYGDRYRFDAEGRPVSVGKLETELLKLGVRPEFATGACTHNAG